MPQNSHFSAPVHEKEQERVKALEGYELLDTSAEPELDELTELAALVCETPISLISLVTADRQWFKSKLGLQMSEAPRTIAFCHYAIHQTGIFEVMDASTDSRFLDNPLVRENPNIRFYAGAPLVTKDGHQLGTLCVIDTEPKILSEEQRSALRVLARQVMLHFELRRLRLEREKERAQLEQAHRQVKETQQILKEHLQTCLFQIESLPEALEQLSQKF